MVGGDSSPSSLASIRRRSDDDDDEPFARGRRLGKRSAHGLILAVSVLFVGASAWQLVRAVFYDPAATEAQLLDPACADGLRNLAAALQGAAAPGAGFASRAPTAPSDDAVARLRRDSSAAWDGADAVRRVCSQSPAGNDAWAALSRLRSAEEQLARQSREELAPLRHDLAAHLPAELR